MIIICFLVILVFVFTNVEMSDAGCERPDMLLNGALIFHGIPNEGKTYEDGVQVSYFCKDGYELRPVISQIRICQNGSWSGITPYCTPAYPRTCSPPELIANGYYESPQLLDRYKIGAQVEYECKPNYNVAGVTKRTCGSDGEWHPKKLPICTSIYSSNSVLSAISPCPLLPKIPNATLKLVVGLQRSNDVFHNSVYAAICKYGYRDSKNPCIVSHLHCIDGSWKGVIPNCNLLPVCSTVGTYLYMKVDSCFPPTIIEHGIVIGSTFDDHYPIAHEIRYTCHNGFTLNLSSSVKYKCNDSGCWFPDLLPVCSTVGTYLYSGDDYLRISSSLLLRCVIMAVIGITSIMIGMCIINVCRHYYLNFQHRRHLRYTLDNLVFDTTYLRCNNSRFVRPNRYNRSAFIAVASDQDLPTYEDVMRQDEAYARCLAMRNEEDYLNSIPPIEHRTTPEINTSDNSTDPFLISDGNQVSLPRYETLFCKDTSASISHSQDSADVHQTRNTDAVNNTGIINSRNSSSNNLSHAVSLSDGSSLSDDGPLSNAVSLSDEQSSLPSNLETDEYPVRIDDSSKRN